MAGVALGDTIDQPVDAAVVGCELQKGRTIEQPLEIDIGRLADQFQGEAKWLADGFVALKGEYLKTMIDAIKAERETCLVGWCRHPESLLKDRQPRPSNRDASIKMRA